MAVRNQKGFTLVEVLIVAVIITILTAIAVPKLDFLFIKDKLRSSTSSVTSSLYLARTKAINDGIYYGVQFNTTTKKFQVVKDPYGTAVPFGPEYKLETGITFTSVGFVNQLAVFTEYGQLAKACLSTGEMKGTVSLTDGIRDSSKVDVTFITGRIREKNYE